MKFKEIHILFFILYLHAIASITTGFFEGDTLHPGTIRGGFVGIFVLYFLISKFKFNNAVNTSIVLYLLYLGILTLLSSDFTTTFYQYTGVFISTIMFPIGLHYIDTTQKLFNVAKAFLFILALFIINFIISNIFQLGLSDYLEDSFYFGAGRVNITKTMVILLFTAPLFFYSVKNIIYRNFGIIIYTATLIICVIGIKRSVLLSLIIGVLVYWYFSPSLTKTAKYYIIAVLIITGSSPLYGDVLKERFEAREARLEFTEERIEEEGRYQEVNRVVYTMRNSDLRHQLFGSELFNDSQFYNTRRMLHTDYMVLLSGAGIIGLAGWLFILIAIVITKINYMRGINKDNYIKLLNAVFWALITAQLIISISGTIYAISLRSYLMLFLGGILGVIRAESIRQKLHR